MAKDGVVLLHGIFRTYRSMEKFAAFLKQNHFKILNIDYPSTRHSIESLATLIHPEIAAFAQSISGKVHFVGYSMGGLLIRAYLHRYRPANLGRVVMVGTPNQGSEVADLLRYFPPYRLFYGPAGQQLITEQKDFLHHFGKVDYDLGIIAGNRSIDPISSRIVKKPNDGKVSVESTRLNGAKDHIVLPCNHTFFPSHKNMWHQALNFIVHGNFRS